MFPAFPDRQAVIVRRAGPSASQISNDAVCLALDAVRVEELTSASASDAAPSRPHEVGARSKLPWIWITQRAVHHRLGELASAILPSGTRRTRGCRRALHRRPPTPTCCGDAQMTALGPSEAARVTATVMPRS